MKAHECHLLREGGRHSVYHNPQNNQTTAIPRHREINDFLGRKICRDLGIPEP
ncbi:MAG: type II toxin-antitoxin system HicA family toxin [Pirellulaceae bacterium]